MGEKRNNVAAAAILLSVALAAGAGIGIIRRSQTVDATNTSVTQAVSSSSPALIDVHVTGWVANPGVVSVAEGAIVADAVAAAGGMRVGANADAVNLAAEVTAGDQIVVPGPEPSDDGAAATDAGGLIDLNRATEGELETLPGVGPVLAERIVAYRKSNGPFEQIEDLLQVPGIGEAKLASLRDLVRP